MTATREGSSWSERAPEIAGNHAAVAGVLAGFSITIVVLILGFLEETANSSRNLLGNAAMGMFLVAFFGYVATGFLFSVVPERDDGHQAFLFVAASTLYYISVVLGFAGLIPLLRYFTASDLDCVLVLFLAAATIGGYFAITIPLVDLLELNQRQNLIVLLCATLLSLCGILPAAIFRLLRETQPLIQMILVPTSLVIAVVFVACLSTFHGLWRPCDGRAKWCATAIAAAGTATAFFAAISTLLLVSA